MKNPARRTSGEIINATLLEIFLSFIFVVLAVAWFKSDQLNAAIAKQREVQAELDSIRKVRVSADSLRTALAQKTAEAALLRAQRNAIFAKYNSIFAPLCSPAYVLTVTPTGNGRLRARGNAIAPGITPGQVWEIEIARFAPAFEPARHHSFDVANCRFRAIVEDSPLASKTEYIRVLRTVEAIFYVAKR